MDDMKSMKSITLVFPRFGYPSGDFSIGLAYISATLKKRVKNLKVSMVDTSFHPSMAYVIRELKRYDADIIAIYADTISMPQVVAISEIAKAMGKQVIIGGPHPTIDPISAFKSPYVDAICIGEGELTLVEYVREFYGKKKYSKVDGIWYRVGQKIIKNRSRELLEDLNRLPYPDYTIFDMKKYISHFYQMDSVSPKLKGISIMASRGCPYDCSYCQPTLKKVFGSRLRIRNPKSIVIELKMLKEKYGIDSFYFQDDTFTIFKKWIIEFCTLLKEEKLGLIWGCNTRADTIDNEMLRMMRDAGMVKLKIGIESISARVRNGILKKRTSRKQINGVLRWCRRLNIQASGFFMLGSPTETRKEVWKTINFAAWSSLKEATFTITTPLPGTHLYDFVESKGWRLPKRYEQYDYYHAKRPRMSRKEMSNMELELTKQFAYFYFYLHPYRIMTTLKTLLGDGGIRKAFDKIRFI